MLALILSIFTVLLPASAESSHLIPQEDTVRKNRSQLRPDTVRTGHYLKVNRIFIIGNRRTREKIILRELSLKTGDVVYSEDLVKILDLDRKKLLNTRLFNTVEIRSLEIEPGIADIIIELNERWYTFPAPILELADRNFNEWWQNYNHDFRRLNYGLRLYQYNMRGRNETLRFHGQAGFQRRLELMYRFPSIDRQQKHGLSVDLIFSETKNLAFRTIDHKYDFIRNDDILRFNRGAALTYTYRNSFYLTHSLRLEYYNAVIRDTVKDLNPLYIKGDIISQRYGSVYYTLNADHRDLIAYPLKGYAFTLIAAKNGLTDADDVQKIEASAQFSKYFPLPKNFYLSTNVVTYWSTPRDVSYVNYGVLGLRKQFVRGYEIYVIEGPYYAMSKSTFKKLIFSRKYHWEAMPLEQFRHIPLSIYIKTYADFGFVKNYPDYEAQGVNTRLSDKLLSGAGAGFDVVGSYDIVLRFEYTFNAEGERGFFFHLKREF